MSMAILISAFKISKSVAGKELLSNLSFGIEENQKIGLIGPNGAGKSTLMKILIGSMKPDSGEITYKRGVSWGYLEQSPQFKKDDTISSFLLDNHHLEPHLLSKAYEWIAKLELHTFDEFMPIEKMSGGWKKRVSLAKELLKEPDILLLDEPTNHLDVTSILWLEDFLRKASFSTVVITHDRLFLQRVCNKILDLDPRFPGHLLAVEDSYEKYLEVKEQMVSAQKNKEQKMTNTLRREKEWLARGAQARLKKQTARINSTLQLSEDVSQLQQLNRVKKFNFEFEASERGPQKLIEAINIGKKQEERWLFKGLHLIITPKTRLAFLGQNGAGKSTLIKTMIGQIPPDEGQVKTAEKLKIAYFDQNRETLDQNMSVLKNICPEGDYVNVRGQFIHCRSYLEKFGFMKEKLDLPIHRLSGGEQARLKIAQLMQQDCQVLILDEPTNDLDIDTLNVLEDSLREFDGAVILVTHDRYFMDQVAQQILSFSPYPEDQGELLTFADYSQWENWHETRLELQKMSSSQSLNKKSSSNQIPSKLPKKLSFKEQFELENMENIILQTETRIKDIETELAKPENHRTPLIIKNLTQELSDLKNRLDELYDKWS